VQSLTTNDYGFNFFARPSCSTITVITRTTAIIFVKQLCKETKDRFPFPVVSSGCLIKTRRHSSPPCRASSWGQLPASPPWSGESSVTELKHHRTVPTTSSEGKKTLAPYVARHFKMAPGSAVKRLPRRAFVKQGPLQKAGLASPAAVTAAALLLLVCAASLRRSAAFGPALAAAPRKLWAGSVSIASAREEEECDLFDGKWVWDDGRPLYDSTDCPFMDAGFRCAENGRPDSSYTKWRWQPARCNLPRLVPPVPSHPSFHYIIYQVASVIFALLLIS
jgi:hypothetical protein